MIRVVDRNRYRLSFWIIGMLVENYNNSLVADASGLQLTSACEYLPGRPS
jgi:hypothetical protein